MLLSSVLKHQFRTKSLKDTVVGGTNKLRFQNLVKRFFNKTSFREPDPNKPRIVLAYSGGLDTSAQLSWLVQEKGFEVCAYIADLGQDDVLDAADVDAICKKAETSGAYAFYCEDVRKEFVTDFVFFTDAIGATAI